MARLKALIIILIAIFVFAGCSRVLANSKKCPPGTKLAGAAPPNGTEQWCERQDAVKEGPYIAWNDNGQKMYEGEYINGNRIGLWTYWHENGLKDCEAEYKDGILHGRWSSWYESGLKKEECKYSNEKIHSIPAGGSPCDDVRYPGVWKFNLGESTCQTGLSFY